MSEKSPALWRFQGFELNTATAELTRNGAPVAIEPQSLRLLDHLIRHRDRIVTRDNLVAEIWQGRAVSDWAISGAIKALRRALDDQQRDKRIIKTAHSQGYRFVAHVATSPLPASTTPRPTLLVRPVRAGPGDDDIAYLAEGLTEDLITALTRSGSRRVLSLYTARAYGDLAPPANAGVTTIIDASMRQIGETLRINIAILDGTGTEQTWAEGFDLTRKTLLAGHDLIAKRLHDVLTPGHPASPALRHVTAHSDAYDHYLKGRYAYYRYGPDAFVEALDHFEKTVQLDPECADAYAQMAYCRTSLHVFGLPGSDPTLDAAEALARKAIVLDDTSALGYTRLGWVLGYRGQPDVTVAAFDAARTRAPDSAEVLLAYGETLNRLARPQQAEPMLDAVFSKDSYFPPSWEFPQGHTQVLLHHHDRAIAHFTSVLARVKRFLPAHVQLARAQWETGDRSAAQASVDAIKTISPKYSLAHAARMFPYPVETERKRLIDALAAAGLG
ncbi:winged helix-turn-helix domain-containing protein [Shimia sp.]|uniref:winged helix-turn-helix domain-containing protein n=1 Tax=Shimia sp. TaxID=1954381 RepID=UPI0032970D1A